MYAGGTDTDTSRNGTGKKAGLGAGSLVIFYPRDCKHLPGMGGDWGRGSRACEQSAAVSAVRGVPQAPAFRWQPLPVSGCHLVSLGRRAGRMGLQAPSIAGGSRKASQNSLGVGPLPWDRPGCGTPMPGTAASTAADPKGGQVASAGHKAQGGARAGSGVPGAARA